MFLKTDFMKNYWTYQPRVCFCCCWMNIERISLWLLLNEHLFRIIERLSPARHLSPLMFPPLRGGNSKSNHSYRFTAKTGSWDKNALKMSQNSNSSEKHQQSTKKYQQPITDPENSEIRSVILCFTLSKNMYNIR